MEQRLCRMNYELFFGKSYPEIALICDRNTWSVNALVRLAIDILEVSIEPMMFDESYLSHVIATTIDDLNLEHDEDICDSLMYLYYNFNNIIQLFPYKVINIDLTNIDENSIWFTVKMKN